MFSIGKTFSQESVEHPNSETNTHPANWEKPRCACRQGTMGTQGWVDCPLCAAEKNDWFLPKVKKYPIWISLLELYPSFETQTSRSYRLPFLPEIHASVGKNTNERTEKQGYLRDTTPFFTRFFTTIVAEKNRLCNMKLYSCPPFHPWFETPQLQDGARHQYLAGHDGDPSGSITGCQMVFVWLHP